MPGRDRLFGGHLLMGRADGDACLRSDDRIVACDEEKGREALVADEAMRRTCAINYAGCHDLG
ncbi:MAG: hypothetical protein FJ029_08290 [Actinobacteria bacterium]|nr:hypothetical protein [Actinomycetota bacterium]